MSERLYSFILIIITIAIVVFLALFKFAGFIPHIGVYEFLSQFDLFVRRGFFPLVLSSLVYIPFKLLVSEEYYSLKIVGRAPRPWISGLVYGMFQFGSSQSLWSLKNSLYRSGVNIGTVWLITLSSYLLPLPLLTFVWALYGFSFFLLYLMISIGICIFLAALGELLQYMKVVVSPDILIRLNPAQYIPFFAVHRLKDFSFKQWITLAYTYCVKVWKIAYLPVFFGIIMAALLSSSIGDDTYRLILGNHMIGQISVILLAAILPLFHMSALMLGYSMTILYNGTGTMFTLLIASFIWRFIYEGISKKVYSKSYVAIFIIILFIISLVSGYLLNLYGGL